MTQAMKKVKLSQDVQDATDALLQLYNSDNESDSNDATVPQIIVERDNTTTVNIVTPCLGLAKQGSTFDGEFNEHHCCQNKKGLVKIHWSLQEFKVTHECTENDQVVEIRLHWMEPVIAGFLRLIQSKPDDWDSKVEEFQKHTARLLKANSLVKHSFDYIVSLYPAKAGTTPAEYNKAKRDLTHEIGRLSVQLHERQTPLATRDVLTRALFNLLKLDGVIQNKVRFITFTNEPMTLQNVSTWVIHGRSVEHFIALHKQTIRYLPEPISGIDVFAKPRMSAASICTPEMKQFFALTRDRKKVLTQEELAIMMKATQLFNFKALMWLDVFRTKPLAESRVLLENNALAAAVLAFVYLMMKKDLEEEYHFLRFLLFPFHQKFIKEISHLIQENQYDITYHQSLSKAFKWGCYQWLVMYNGDPTDTIPSTPVVPIPIARNNQSLYCTIAVVTMAQKGYFGLPKQMQEELNDHLSHKAVNFASDSKCIYCQILHYGFHKLKWLNYMPSAYIQSPDFGDQITTPWYANMEKFYTSVGASFFPYDKYRTSLFVSQMKWHETPVGDAKTGAIVHVKELPTPKEMAYILKRSHGSCKCKPGLCRYKLIVDIPENEVTDQLRKHFEPNHASHICNGCYLASKIQSGLVHFDHVGSYCATPN